MTSSQVAAALRFMADQIEDAASKTEDDESAQGLNRFTPGVGINEHNPMAAVRSMGCILVNPYLAAFAYDLRPLEKDMMVVFMLNKYGDNLEAQHLDDKISTAKAAGKVLRETITGLEMVYYSLKFFQHSKECLREADDNVFADDRDHENIPVRLANCHAHTITEPHIEMHHHDARGAPKISLELVYQATDGTYDEEARQKDADICLRRMQAAIQEFETFHAVVADYLNTLQKASNSKNAINLMGDSD